MNNVWVDANNDANPAVLKRWQISRAYYDARDPRLTPEYLQLWASRVGGVGLYRAASWNPTITPGAFAALCSSDIARLYRGGIANSPYCMDIETHDVSWLVATLQAWRKVRPTRTTLLTIEGMQGGLFNAASVAAVNASNVLVCPQCYDGSMHGWASDRVVQDLITPGFLPKRIYCVYDAAQIADLAWWQGTMFTQGRLPA